MDIYNETKVPLQKIWVDGDQRQKAKIVLMAAIGNASETSVKVATDILDEIDRILDDSGEDKKNTTNSGL